MPSVVGMSARDAVYELEKLGLLVKLEGKGRVISQSIGYNTRIKKSDKVELKLSSTNNTNIVEIKPDTISDKLKKQL